MGLKKVRSRTFLVPLPLILKSVFEDFRLMNFQQYLIRFDKPYQKLRIFQQVWFYLALSGHFSQVFLESLDLDGGRILQSGDLFHLISLRVKLASERFDLPFSSCDCVIEVQNLLLVVTHFSVQGVDLMRLTKRSS